LNKEQKLFWDLLRNNYPPESERSCRNCINNDHLQDDHHEFTSEHGFTSEVCHRCRIAGADDYHTVWQWDGTMI